MDPKLAKELDEFNKRKDDVFKNINLLNSLSESLVNSISEEESKIIQKKNKEIIENEKKKTANELELLGLENSKMESYLEILSKKQDLEMRYLEQMCNQHAKIHKLEEKYSFLNINDFLSYDIHYKSEIKDARKQYVKKNLKKGTVENENEKENDTSEKEGSSTNQPPPPCSAPPSKLPFPKIDEEPLNDDKSDFELESPKKQTNNSTPDAEPPPKPPPPPIPFRRFTVASPERMPKKDSPQRRPSLQDQLKAALAEKFSLAGTTTKPPGHDESDSDGSNWA